MDKRGKVIKGLECCAVKIVTPDAVQHCGICPYDRETISEMDFDCRNDLICDALELLKAQYDHDTNAGEWTTKRTQAHDGEWYCSECGYEPIVMTDDMKYCPGCGRKMTMPEPPKEG